MYRPCTVCVNSNGEQATQLHLNKLLVLETICTYVAKHYLGDRHERLQITKLVWVYSRVSKSLNCVLTVQGTVGAKKKFPYIS